MLSGSRFSPERFEKPGVRVRRERCNRGKAPDACGQSRVSRPAVAGLRQRIPGEEGEVPRQSTKTFSVLSDRSGKGDEGP